LVLTVTSKERSVTMESAAESRAASLMVISIGVTRVGRGASGDPPFRYVPKERQYGMQIVLPMVGLMTSLDVGEGVPMDVWPTPPTPTEEAD